MSHPLPHTRQTNPLAATAPTPWPAVHSVDEFVFSMPDLTPTRHFYSHFGLDVRELPATGATPAALALYRHGHAHRWARLLVGPQHRSTAANSCAG